VGKDAEEWHVDRRQHQPDHPARRTAKHASALARRVVERADGGLHALAKLRRRIAAIIEYPGDR